MKLNKKILIIFVIIILCSTLMINVWATDKVNNLTNMQKETEEQLKEETEKLEQVESDISTALQEVQKLTENITTKEAEIRTLNREIKELEKNIEETEKNLKEAQEKFNKQQELLKNRMVALYEAGDTSYLDVLLSSSDFSDFLSNYFLVAELAEFDNEILTSLEEEQAKIESYKTKLEQDKKQITAKKENAEQLAVVLKNNKTLKNKEVNKLNEDEKQIQENIDKYEREVALIEEEISRLTASDGTVYSGGVMAWPVPGYSNITSQFGMRYHPITGVYKLHSGVDIGAPTGASFIAAASGTVAKAGYNSAYGNMVIINHGGGISTLYAHGSAIMVSEGQTVTRGDVVLKVGSTGYSTGSHAHFEVRVNGDYKNPLNYITGNN